MQTSKQVKILSAGALKPALPSILSAFGEETGCEATAEFATAPAISERLRGGEAASVVLAPPGILDELTESGHFGRGERVAVGRIGVGVLVRAGAPLPKIDGVEDFKHALKSAEALVYNQASTGIYLSTLFDRLGIGPELTLRSIRYPDFSGVLDHIRRGGRREIGFGATTVIVENEIRGVKFAGPLPDAIQNYTEYAAAVLRSEDDDAAKFVGYLASDRAQSILQAAGII